jgi:hypothetical protein
MRRKSYVRVAVLAFALALVPAIAMAQDDDDNRPTRTYRVPLYGIKALVVGVVGGVGWLVKKATGKA